MYYTQSPHSYFVVASSLRRIDIHHTESNRFNTCTLRSLTLNWLLRHLR